MTRSSSSSMTRRRMRLGVWVALSVAFAMAAPAVANDAQMNFDLTQEAGATEMEAPEYFGKAILPERPDLHLPVGEPTTVIATIRVGNSSVSNFVCNSIHAMVSSPYDYKVGLQAFNWSEPVEELKLIDLLSDKSLSLQIVPDKNLGDRDFMLQVSIECRWLQNFDRSKEVTLVNYKQGLPIFIPCFNETVTMVDNTSALDGDLLLLVLIFAATIFGFAYLFTDLFAEKKQKSTKRAARKRVETGTGDASNEEWLEGTYHPASATKKSS